MKNVNILCFCEHWLRVGEIVHLENYNLVSSFYRKDKIHGGDCIYLKNLSFVELDLQHVSCELSLECCGILCDICPIGKIIFVYLYPS